MGNKDEKERCIPSRDKTSYEKRDRTNLSHILCLVSSTRGPQLKCDTNLHSRSGNSKQIVRIAEFSSGTARSLHRNYINNIFGSITRQRKSLEYVIMELAILDEAHMEEAKLTNRHSDSSTSKTSLCCRHTP
ncbi:hypothetical protein CHS0354_023170 [Potamilus streckersoni]|uniref:Uncharacterized protein n=1 Tax=Potamilus streckersoni TaxID=2493646 RepID=A0AAE0TBK0_9BIVA|nr:hypothetical protein CHS0354_023170 [Potamilus streckersoni]